MTDDNGQPKTERQEWDALVTAFDAEYLIYKPVGQRMGKILYQMKVHLRKHRLDKGRRGRWKAFLDERHIPESTAKDWVVNYQKAEAIRLERCFFPSETKRTKVTRKTHNYGKKNTAVSAALAKVAAADEVDPKKADDSDDHRTAVECVFVLTQAERWQFMEAVRKLGELGATQVMYRAIVVEAFGTQTGRP
jgi:hypothetical protein